MSTLTSRVFMNGNSQAVRIPHEFRLQASKVEISRTQEGDLIIHAVSDNRGAALLSALEGFDDEFAEILQDEQDQQLPMQDREEL